MMANLSLEPTSSRANTACPLRSAKVPRATPTRAATRMVCRSKKAEQTLATLSSDCRSSRPPAPRTPSRRQKGPLRGTLRPIRPRTGRSTACLSNAPRASTRPRKRDCRLRVRRIRTPLSDRPLAHRPRRRRPPPATARPALTLAPPLRLSPSSPRRQRTSCDLCLPIRRRQSPSRGLRSNPPEARATRRLLEKRHRARPPEPGAPAGHSRIPGPQAETAPSLPSGTQGDT